MKTSFIDKTIEKVTDFIAEQRTWKTRDLPAGEVLKSGNVAIVANGDPISLTVYVYSDNLWRKKIIPDFPCGLSVKNVCKEDKGLILQYEERNDLSGKETIEIVSDLEEEEAYFLRTIQLKNKTKKDIKIDGRISSRYIPEAPVSDFTYVSYKWMGRKVNLGRYHDPDKGYTGSRANNQLFYNYSGGIYIGIAYLDIERYYLSDCAKNDGFLYQTFSLGDAISLRPSAEIGFHYAIFAGTGRESHIGHLSNVLWRLNWQKDPSFYAPQTDIRDY